MDDKVMKFIEWVEGRHTPANEEEESELVAYGELVYPLLRELYYSI